MNEGSNGTPVTRAGEIEGARWRATVLQLPDGRLEVIGLQLWHGPSATPIRLSDGRATYASFEELDDGIAAVATDFIRNMRF
ncbi:hypothetical protein ACQQ2N_04370 [Dokdonella sp. MW10]|uniref:hypothetical protein n=1 Tax=Dokdonella sp. MW10 TaxID=2992926 RepID=UPI003F803D13